MRSRWATLVAMAVLATALAVPGAASASTTEAIADTGGMTVSLGVLGSPLDVSVTLDEIGHITEVTVGDGYSEDKSSEHQVRFSHDEDATRIDVRAKEHKLTASVKAADLASILGNHTWSAALFGSDTESSVTFEVVENGSGYPELTNVAVTGLFPADATYEISAIDNELEDDEAESSVRITFMWNGYTMTLKIKAEMEFEDDGDDDDDELSVKLKFELRGKDIQLLRDQELAALAGAHSWDGRLCDGTPVAVGYTIGGSGEVTVDTVTVDGAATDGYDLDTKSHGFKLEFDDSKAKVTVELKQKDDGTWDLKVKSKTTEKCDHDDDHDDDDDDDDHGDQDDDDDKDKKHDDDDDDDDDDEDDD